MLTMSTCVCWSEEVSAAGPKAPMKFYVPHVPVSFGPGGQLVCVSPSSPRDGQTALVELHSMEVNKIWCPWNASTLLPASLYLSLGISRNGVLSWGAGPCTLWIGECMCVKEWVGLFSERSDARLMFFLICYWLIFSNWRTHFHPLLSP